MWTILHSLELLWADWVGTEWNGDCWGVDRRSLSRRITSPRTVEVTSEGPMSLLPPVMNLWSSLFQELLWGSISVWQMDASPDFPKWFLEEVASCDVWSCYRTRVVVHKPDVSTLLLWYSLRAHFHTQWEEALRLCSTFFFPSHFVLSCFFISRKTQLSSSLFRSQHQKEKWLRSICFSTGVYIMTFLEVKLEMKPLV